MTDPHAPPPRRAGRTALAVVGVVVLLAVAAAYLARKVIAREVLTGWLKVHGVASQVEIDGLGPGALGGRIRLGDPRAPDATVEAVRVTYGLRGLTFEVRSVTLRAPVLRARLHDGRLSLGALDPLIADLRRRPPQADTAQPRIRVESGVLLLATDYGPLRLTADAQVEAGRLVSADARLDPARLHAPAFDLSLGETRVQARTTEERVALTLDGAVQALRAGALTAAGTRLTLSANAPYPDLKRKRLDGAIAVRGGLVGGRIDRRADHLTLVRLDATMDGQASGGIADFALIGTATADVSAGGAVSGARVANLRARLKGRDLRWTRKPGDKVAANLAATLTAQSVEAGDLRVSEATADVQGPVILASDGLHASLTAGLASRGAWGGLGLPAASAPPELAAFRRAAAGFRVSAPAVRFDLAPAGLRIDLPRPAQVVADSAARLAISSRNASAVFGPDGGAVRLALQGGGLPTLNADVRRLEVANGGVVVQGEAKIAGSFGLAQGATADISGALRIANGGVRLVADRCAPVSVSKLVFGANDIERLSGRLCPWDGPVLTLAHGDWRLRGAFDGLAAAAPFLQARITGGAGSVTAGQTGGRLAVTAFLGEAKLLDAARDIRFNPLQVGGTATLADARWGGDLKFESLTGKALGAAHLAHDTRDGRGGLAFDTGSLLFTEGGLQPVQLSPLAAALASPVEGRARFVGHTDWTPQGVTSRGTLSIPGLDFQSAAGKVSGLKGEIVFESLAPLTAAPGQSLQADAIAAIVPIAGVTARVGLDSKALTITGGEASVGGGRVRIESLSVPLSPDAPMTGLLSLEGVQLHDLVEASPFGDRVDLDAKVSGHVPFQAQGGKVRVSAAELHAIQPGRLSIARQALTGVAAGGAVSAPTGAAAPVPANDTFTDFAYQAMENLAFDKLDASIASRDDGRLGVLAHVVGRHDPPQRQEIRLSLFDLIGRKFLNKPLPLPSDTGVNLTLDTTLNLDDLLADYAAYRDLRGSPAVQPPTPIPETKPLETPR